MTPQPWRILKISGIILASLLGIAVLVVVAVYVNFYNETRDPMGPRSCECQLLTQWATILPLTPQGDQLSLENVTTNEHADGFQFGGGLEGVDIDRRAILDTLTSHGLNHRTDIDLPDQWNTIFYPGASASDGPWTFDVTAEETGIGIRIDVAVDGSPWGLETNEDVHDFYVEDHQAALTAQEERQRQAIEALHPLQEALQFMVQGR